jgi:hypothetical protein
LIAFLPLAIFINELTLALAQLDGVCPGLVPEPTAAPNPLRYTLNNDVGLILFFLANEVNLFFTDADNVAINQCSIF